jgi:hypothetical protein
MILSHWAMETEVLSSSRMTTQESSCSMLIKQNSPTQVGWDSLKSPRMESMRQRTSPQIYKLHTTADLPVCQAIDIPIASQSLESSQNKSLGHVISKWSSLDEIEIPCLDRILYQLVS